MEHKVYIKLYGAAGAALAELMKLGDKVTVPEVVKAKQILQTAIDEVEQMVYPSESADKG